MLESAGFTVQLLLLDGRLPALGDGSASHTALANEVMTIFRNEAERDDQAPTREEEALRRIGALLGHNERLQVETILNLQDERFKVPVLEGRR